MAALPTHSRALLVPLCFAILLPLLARAGGVGISTPGHPPEGQGAQLAGVSFNPYKVSANVSPRARRDLEFL